LLAAVTWMSSGLLAERGIEDRAVLDRDDGVARCLGKAGAQHAVLAAARMQRDAAAAGAVGVDQKADLAGDAGLLQRLDHDRTLPGAIGLRLPMLDGAAAAATKILAKRRDALGARPFDLD
jgi:hypothetical protein